MDTSRNFGYARVSSTDQNLNRQFDQLQEYVRKENIFYEKKSGKNFSEREVYQQMKEYSLRPGDSLYVISMDRLGRDKQEIKEEVEWLRKHDIKLKIMDVPTTMVDFPKEQEWIQDMVFNILVEVLASIAQEERLKILSRQRQGITSCKLHGKSLGRPVREYPSSWDVFYPLWRKGEMSAAACMRAMGIKRDSFYRFDKRYRVESGETKAPENLSELIDAYIRGDQPVSEIAKKGGLSKEEFYTFLRMRIVEEVEGDCNA